MWLVSTQTIVAAVAVTVCNAQLQSLVLLSPCGASPRPPHSFMATYRFSSTASAQYSDGATGRSPVCIPQVLPQPSQDAGSWQRWHHACARPPAEHAAAAAAAIFTCTTQCNHCWKYAAHAQRCWGLHKSLPRLAAGMRPL